MTWHQLLYMIDCLKKKMVSSLRKWLKLKWNILDFQFMDILYVNQNTCIPEILTMYHFKQFPSEFGKAVQFSGCCWKYRTRFKNEHKLSLPWLNKSLLKKQKTKQTKTLSPTFIIKMTEYHCTFLLYHTRKCTSTWFQSQSIHI